MRFGPYRIRKGGGSLVIYIPKLVRERLALKHGDICQIEITIIERCEDDSNAG